MVVVTRYYGGVKLGVGGLVRAYGGSAARCIDLADTVEVQPRLRCVIEAAHQWTGQLYVALDQSGAERLGESFLEQGIRIDAEVLDEAGAAIVIPESRLAVETLSEQIATVLTNPEGAQQMAQAALSVAMPDAPQHLADMVEELAGSRQP